jgi:hypothetical protein
MFHISFGFFIFVLPCKSEKDDQGRWRFKDESVAFGKGHHAHKYPVGHKGHSLRTVNGVPMATIITAASVYDQKAILSLLDELKGRYPDLPFAYILLDRGYDAEEIHQDIYEQFDIIPICDYLKEQYRFGYISHTYFTNGYRKFGPALPHNAIYQKLKPLRTGIERTFGLVKENRYRMEETNFYKGIDNVTIHDIEHDKPLPGQEDRQARAPHHKFRWRCLFFPQTICQPGGCRPMPRRKRSTRRR